MKENFGKKKTEARVIEMRPGEKIELAAPTAKQRADSYTNLVTGLGTSMDKRNATRILWDDHPPEFYEQLYSGGGLAARIVDLIPETSLRNGNEWPGLDKPAQEALNDQCGALDLRGGMLRSWKWGRAYGGACMHIVTDTNNPAGPLRQGEKILAFRDLSRWDLRIMTTDVEFDFAHPNYGHPRIYYLNVQMGSQYKAYPIHWTRMVRFDGQLVPRRTFIRNNYWHDSILNRLYPVLRDYISANDAVGACLQDFNVDVFKMKNLANMIAAGQTNLVQQRIELLAFAKSVINAMILDADEEDYDNKGRTLQGVAELLVHQANRLVAETDIPHTLLLGESPDGSNATGNSTDKHWQNFIGSEQEHYLKPKLQRLITLISKKPKLGIKFRSLVVLDDVEKADLRLKVAQADQIYFEMGAVDASEITQSRFGGDEWSMETALDTEARASGEIVSGQQPVQEGDENGDFGADGGEGDGGDDGNKNGDPKPAGKKEKRARAEKTDIEHESVAREPAPRTEERAERVGAPSVEGFGVGDDTTDMGGVSEFEPRNEILEVPNGKPAITTFIGQTMSEPMRDPRTDPPMKGPGIPNNHRNILPTRGTGLMAPSGYAWGEEDLDGNSVEGKRADGSPEPKRRRAATIIVMDGGKFLMGKTNEEGKWTCPGGWVDDLESVHGGALRELAEETGIVAKKLKFLGTRLVESEKGNPTEVSMYSVNWNGTPPTGKKDPDKEVSKWEWFDSKQALSPDVLMNLKHANNVVLDHLGLLK